MAHKYILRVTAGPDYNVASHTEVPVNTAVPTKISSALAEIELNVRIQNYTGLPHGSPRTSPYFEKVPHKANDDQYSVCFRFTPKKPPPKAAKEGSDGTEKDGAAGIKASHLQFGNDLDNPIRDHLPPGINTAIHIVKWWIDPGLEGDVYADKPYFYGPALSSMNVVHCGAASQPDDAASGLGLWFEEGGDTEGMAARQAVGAPTGAKERMKWALGAESKEKWMWEYGKTYGMDFFNPYLDFNNFSLRLPGFQMGILRYWDGQGLRYVLRNKSTGDVYLVVMFSPYLREDVGDDGKLKISEENARRNAAAGRSLDASPTSREEGTKKEETKAPEDTSIEDVD